jgi:hypothetical protein
LRSSGRRLTDGLISRLCKRWWLRRHDGHECDYQGNDCEGADLSEYALGPYVNHLLAFACLISYPSGLPNLEAAKHHCPDWDFQGIRV